MLSIGHGLHSSGIVLAWAVVQKEMEKNNTTKTDLRMYRSFVFAPIHPASIRRASLPGTSFFPFLDCF